MLVLATARDEVRRPALDAVGALYLPARVVASAADLLRAIAAPTTRLVLVDPELPGVRAEQVADLAAAMDDPPVVKSLGRALGPIPRLPFTAAALSRAARGAGRAAALDDDLRAALRGAGVASRPAEALARLGSSGLPVRLVGERGTGKARIARALHALTAAGPFVALAPESDWHPAGAPGTLYLEDAHRRPAVLGLAEAAADAGWNVVAGTRDPTAHAELRWATLVLPPLRERPADLRQLCESYLATHARRLGGRAPQLDRALWSLVLAHRWPGNQRELEGFVVQLLVAVDRDAIRVRDLPRALDDQLRSRAATEEEALVSFEALAEARLQPVVSAWVPGGEPSLHSVVVDGCERALLRLALARTHGSRKGAAQLLGLARNTLAAKVARLGLGISAAGKTAPG